jgi:hypothetical protein
MLWIVFKVDLNKSLGSGTTINTNLQICLWPYAVTKPNINSNTKPVVLPPARVLG